MAWTEQTALRGRRSRAYQDDSAPSKRAVDCTIAPLHYPSVLDSGVYNTELDMTPVRIDNAQLDGWRVAQADYHYALGWPGDKPNDGWVGFGGRQGAHWFKFRLLRTGYLHWPTRTWDDIGGSPTYDRASLSQQTHAITLATKDDSILASSTAIWTGLWLTPGGGDVSAMWRVDGGRLKEEITVNEAARGWIAANRPPATPLAETYFGFVFSLDWSDIPKCVRAGVQQDIDGDFADDGEGIELQDALDRLLAFMPVSDVRVMPPGEAPTYEPLRKRFYHDGGNHYLAVGVRCDLLNAMPAGDLVFDPTIDPQVAGNDYDARERADDSNFSSTTLEAIEAVDAFNRWHAGLIFTVIGPSSGDIIDVAYIRIRINTGVGRGDDPELDIYCEDVDDADDFAGTPDIVNRPRTAGSAGWSATDLGDNNWVNSPSTVAPVEDVITDRVGWNSGQDLCVILWGRSTAGNKGMGFDAYEDSASDAAILHIEYAGAAVAGKTSYVFIM